MTQTPQDFTKFASDLGYDTQEKLAHSMTLLKAVIDRDGGAGSFDKMAEEQVGYFAPLWMMFEKTAEKAGADLPSCDVDQVVDAFVTYVKEAEEEAKKDDKDKEKKDEEENQKKASAHFQKVAYEASMESFFRHLGEQAADAMMAKLAGSSFGGGTDADAMAGNHNPGPAAEAKKGVGQKLKDLATKGKDAVVGAAEKHPRTAKGLGAAAGLAAAGGAAAAGYKHFKKKDSEGPASEEKKAFDLLAAQTALAFVKQAQQGGANVSIEGAVRDLNDVLHKLAQDGGNDESEGVKQASAAGNGQEALNIRAAELLSMAGYTWLG